MASTPLRSARTRSIGEVINHLKPECPALRPEGDSERKGSEIIRDTDITIESGADVLGESQLV